MKVYICILLLLNSIYISFAYADEKKQHLVSPAVNAPVFMPLDRYRTVKGPTHRAERFFPLSSRLPNRQTEKKLEKMDAPSPKTDTTFLTMPKAQENSQNTGSDMTTDQAKQILSIFGQ